MGLNPPRSLTATSTPSAIDLSWQPPLPPGELGYDDGSAETGFGFSATGEFAVRFTPNVYPSKLLAIKAYWVGITNPLDAVEYSVLVNPTGGDAPPTTEVIANTPYTVPARNQFNEIDISGSNISVNSGDFFFSLVQPDTFNYGIGLDQDGFDVERTWLSFDGVSWQKLSPLGFPDNLMVRALVQEGVGKDARIVELAPTGDVSEAPEMDLVTLKQLRIQASRQLELVGVSNRGINNPPQVDGLTGFNIYRSTDNAAYSLLATVADSISTYSDGAVSTGTTYYYYVTAQYDEGESDSSNIASAEPGAPVLSSLVHTPGDLNAGIFNDGSIGAENVNFTGPGVSWKGANGLFTGGVIFGTAAAGSVNGQIGSFGNISDMTIQSSTFDGGFTADGNFDQIAEATITDGNAPTPFGLPVVQKSYSNTGEEFMIVRYGFVNNTGAQLDGLYAGIFIDWDIANFATNSGGYSPSENLVYQFDNAGAYYGMSALENYSGGRVTTDTPPGDARSGSFQWITTEDLNSVGANGDYRSWIGAGPFDGIAPGDTAWATFAIVAGDDLQGIRDNAHAASVKAFNVGFVNTVLAIGDTPAGLPQAFALEQNYPNPFNPTTTLQYALKENVDVKLAIYNVLGQLVRTLVNEQQIAGFKEVVWDGANDFGVKVASGIYIYRLQAGDFVKSRKMILMK